MKQISPFLLSCINQSRTRRLGRINRIGSFNVSIWIGKELHPSLSAWLQLATVVVGMTPNMTKEHSTCKQKFCRSVWPCEPVEGQFFWLHQGGQWLKHVRFKKSQRTYTLHSNGYHTCMTCVSYLQGSSSIGGWRRCSGALLKSVEDSLVPGRLIRLRPKPKQKYSAHV